ncbi:GNAT family N-acetyltransferase [Streptomyces monticola]|uniref:GNAT family N-acetyltransferase n=1 Tax=Streptomyces monticola TaxID=2666263 RepID=A0ABW2JNU8_9ACTN
MTDIPAALATTAPDTGHRNRLADDATAAADAAARAAGCRVQPVSALPDLESVCRLFAGIWTPGGENGLVTTELLRAMDKAGNYVAAAFDASEGDSGGGSGAGGIGHGDGRRDGRGDGRGDGGELVGACIGFFGPPPHGALHSHIAGVSARMRGRSVGFALKAHQRAWALQRGATQVSWTFDPLVRRNAFFNITKLAARPAEYLTNFYGRMNDGINGADDTDRLLVDWRLAAPEVAAACHGHHRPADTAAARAAGAAVALGITADGRPTPGRVTGTGALVAVPADIEHLRRSDPRSAAAWRSALRDALGGPLADGWRVSGFDRDGWYILQREDAQ